MTKQKYKAGDVIRVWGRKAHDEVAAFPCFHDADPSRSFAAVVEIVERNGSLEVSCPEHDVIKYGRVTTWYIEERHVHTDEETVPESSQRHYMGIKVGDTLIVRGRAAYEDKYAFPAFCAVPYEARYIATVVEVTQNSLLVSCPEHDLLNNKGYMEWFIDIRHVVCAYADPELARTMLAKIRGEVPTTEDTDKGDNVPVGDSGLCQSSVGDLFPYIILAIETERGTRYGVQYPNGYKVIVSSMQVAEATARAAKGLRRHAKGTYNAPIRKHDRVRCTMKAGILERQGIFRGNVYAVRDVTPNGWVKLENSHFHIPSDWVEFEYFDAEEATKGK